MNQQKQVADEIRIISILSTTTRTPIRTLIDVALAAKNPVLGWDDMPKGSVVKLVLIPGASVLVSDPQLVDETAITARTEYCVMDAHEKLCLKNAATVLVELHFGDR